MMVGCRRHGLCIATSLTIGCLLVITALLLTPPAAWAATPASGTINSTSTTQTWCGTSGCLPTMVGAANNPVGFADCSSAPCDTYTLTVGTVPAGSQVAISISWTDPANDYDLWVYDASGNVVCSSTGGAPETSEACSIPAIAGTYQVKSLLFTVVADNYTGTASLQAPPVTIIPNFVTGGISFSPNVTVKAPVAGRDGEPSNRTDYQGNAYVSAIRGFPAGVDLWHFDLNPSSSTYDPQLRNPSYRGQPDAFPTNALFDVGADGGGDVDLAVGFEPPAVGNGLPNLTEVSLIAANISSSLSQDLGNTFTLDPAASYIPADDRQWIEAYKGNVVFMSYRAPIPLTATDYLWVATSLDGGLTWPVTSEMGNDGTTPGYISVDQNSAMVYVAHQNSGALFISRAQFDPANPETPLNFSKVTVDTSTSHGHLFDSVKVGHDGTVYALWSNDQNIYYAYSIDQGRTWSNKIQVNNPNFVVNDRFGNPQTVKTNVMPWMEAGSAGRVDFVWFGTTDASNDDNADWNVFFAQASNANSSTPTVQQVVASDHFVHAGNISEQGLGGAANRNLLDYFQVSLDPQGAAMIAFGDDHNDFTGHTYVTHQISGPSAFAGIGTVPTLKPAPIPAQNPNLPQVTDFRDDVGAETAAVPGDNARDITSIAYGCQATVDGSTLLTTTMQLSSLATIPPESNWRVNLSANALAGLADRADQFFLQASTETQTPTFTWGTAVRNSDGSISYTTRGATDVGYFDTANNQVVMKVNLNQLNQFASKPLGTGSTLIGLRGSTFEIPITVNNAPVVGTTSVSAPRDITRGGTIPIGVALQGDTVAGIGIASYTIANCSGATVQPPPPPPPGTQQVASESGDGTIPAGASSGKFHFDVDNSPGGQLTYNDQGAGVSLVSTSITFFTPPSGDNCVSFGGTARLNNDNNHIFTVKACDNGNNGASDTFSISIDSNYSASGTLTNGNINIHEK